MTGSRGLIKGRLRDRKDDLRETPPEAVRTLLKYEKLPPAIWEPCAGRGAIVKHLKHAGHVVAASDLVKYPDSEPGITTGVDFLMTTTAPFGVKAIVTNPPYKLADKFILHGLGFGMPVIVLLRLLSLEGSKRSEIIDCHLARVLLGKERLPMMHKPDWEGPKLKQGREPFGWFVFLPMPHDDKEGFTVRRVSWYANEPLYEKTDEWINHGRRRRTPIPTNGLFPE